jgi:DNA-binding NarL/FixJ family response regulator
MTTGRAMMRTPMLADADADRPQDKLRVLLVDDHPIVRSGLRVLVDAQPDMFVVGEAEDGLAGIAAVASLTPDVVVMDLAMPNLGGVEATECIKMTAPHVKVLGLSAHDERGYVQVILAAGASGYVLKRSATADLVRALRAIAAGGVYLDPAIAGHVVADGSKRAKTGGTQLSEREVEVLRMLAEGHGVKEAAATLEISTRTLETYRARAMEKLGLKSRAEIVRYALNRGWLKNG